MTVLSGSQSREKTQYKACHVCEKICARIVDPWKSVHADLGRLDPLQPKDAIIVNGYH